MAAPQHHRRSIGFWVGAVLGAALVGFGVRGMLVTEPRGASSAFRWLVGSALVLDLLVVPLAATIGWSARRLTPLWAWPVIRAALVVSGVLVLFALPLVTDQGGTPANPTVRPRDYEEGLLVALIWTWAIAGLWIALRRRVTRRGADAPTTDAGAPTTTT